MDDQVRVHVKRNSKKKSGYEVELRSDGFYYVKSVPSRRSKIQPGDRVLEINGVKFTDFKTASQANSLIDTLILDVQEETEFGSGEESYDESQTQSESSEY